MMRTDEWEDLVTAGPRWRLAVIIALLAFIGGPAQFAHIGRAITGRITGLPYRVPVQRRMFDSYGGNL